jgi:RimJ/RimL family protein N-acetyltransferase
MQLIIKMNEYMKIAYVWEELQPKIFVPKRLSFDQMGEIEFRNATALVGQVMANSLDRGDQKQIFEIGKEQAASRFLNAVKEDFDYKEEWWQVGSNAQGEIVGFLQPVIFRGWNKGALEEGTIYYIGVKPEYRGTHYIYDLLCQATRILQKVGVWRIYCDTDVLNSPMINVFQEVGYKQYGKPKETASGFPMRKQ